jgi:5-carboxymethyl-2-hydroxymuconate isomerase
MPHFVLDCSEDILAIVPEVEILRLLHGVAKASDLFDESDIKVRVNPFKNYLVGNNKTAFMHVFAHIMQGRTTEQKAKLSKTIVTKLSEMFPQVSNIAMNVSEFEKATYYNKSRLINR